MTFNDIQPSQRTFRGRRATEADSKHRFPGPGANRFGHLPNKCADILSQSVDFYGTNDILLAECDLQLLKLFFFRFGFVGLLAYDSVHER